jgi:deazaflavin-dependent oxidoreductase (nitroreductase family)
MMVGLLGSPTNPDWYYNILANPDVTIEVGTEKFQAHANVITEEPERTRLMTRWYKCYHPLMTIDAKPSA